MNLGWGYGIIPHLVDYYRPSCGRLTSLLFIGQVFRLRAIHTIHRWVVGYSYQLSQIGKACLHRLG